MVIDMLAGIEKALEYEGDAGIKRAPSFRAGVVEVRAFGTHKTGYGDH